ncbi:MAG: glycosyltransferase [Ignavibacteriae bacterium]|nr:glycosyltransferase [Ignavibacteriota bacterium]
MQESKSVCVYSPYWANFGGGEKYIASVADVLAASGQYNVTLLASDSSITKEKLRGYFNIPLERIRFETIGRNSIARRLGAADIAFIVSNFRSYGTPGKRTVYVLQIPYGPIEPLSIATKALKHGLSEALKDCSRVLLLRAARRSDAVLVYSHFVAETLRRHHRVDATVLYPPIDDFRLETQKRKTILSVGRFFRGLYNDKRYDILIDAFKQLYQRLGDAAWEYRLVGSCTTDNPSQKYLAELRERARGYPISFHVNSSFEDLRHHYNDATLFWHAAGYCIDDERNPDRVEHFGMTTVEAMSAKCVPIVMNKGGQKEIVSHDESGYLWNTLDEVVEYSLRVIRNPDLLTRMQLAARNRSTEFNLSRFSRQLLQFIQSLTPQNHGKE